MRKLFFLLTAFALVLSCSSDETSTPVTPPPAPIVKYTITLSAGEGGTVSTTGGEYEAGQTVSVTATPQGEYVFTSWSDGNTNATRTITVSSNSTLTANFEKRKYPLTVNFEGEGEVIEEIVNAGRTTDYDSGTTVKLTAQAAAEWIFVGWTGDIESTEESVQIVIGEPKEVTATFEKKKYPLSVNIEGEGEVIEEIVEAGRTTGYDSGTTVKLTAEPADEWLFTGWSGDIGDIDPTENPIQLSIIESKTVTATFEKKKYPLTVNIEGEGEVLEEIVNTGRTTDYNSGTTVKLTAVPAEGWEFVKWTGVESLNNFEIEVNITETSNIIALFRNNCNVKNYNNKSPKTSYRPLDINPFFNYFKNTEFDSEDMTLYATNVKFNSVDFRVVKVISNHLDENKGFIQITDLENNELFSFRSPQNFTAKLLTVDIDNNGFEDVVLIGTGIDTHPYSGDSNFILYNYENSYELKILDPEVGYFHAGAAGDVNNDGWIDILPIRRNVGNGYSYLYLNNGDKTFRKVPFGSFDLYQNTLHYEFYDINNDGYLDLFFGGKEYVENDEDNNLPGITRVSFGGESGIDPNIYLEIPSVEYRYTLITGFNFYDLNNDGQAEVIISRSGPPGPDYYSTLAMQILEFNGSTFKTSSLIKGPEGVGWAFKTYLDDVDGDCLIDIIPWGPDINDDKRDYNPRHNNSYGLYLKSNSDLLFETSFKDF